MILVIIVFLAYKTIPQVNITTNIMYNEYFPSKEVTEVKTKVEKIRDNFLKVVREEGHTLPYVPDVFVAYTPELTFFAGDKEEGFLCTSTWHSIPEELKSFLEACMMRIKSDWSGEKFFNQNLNWFVVPRELGHYLQVVSDVREIKEGDRWANELYANKVAVAFWLNQGKEKELEKFIFESIKLVDMLGSPTPEGVDEQKYFNENYKTLVQNNKKYCYYKLLLYKKAWDEKGKSNKIIITKLQ